MIIANLTNSSLKNGEILTGRSALSYYNLGCSCDPRVIMVIGDVDHDIYYEPLWVIPREDNFEFAILDNGYRIATVNQALYHTFLYDYDYSCIYELLETIDEEMLNNFIIWLQETDRYNSISDKLESYEI